MDLATDVTFLVKKSEDMLEALEKKLSAIKYKAAENACNMFNTYPDGEKKNYPNENATISYDAEFYVKHPSDPSKDGFEKFVKQLPPEALRPYYPTVAQLISEKLAAGDQIPFGLPKFGIISVTPKVRCLSKKEL